MMRCQKVSPDCLPLSNEKKSNLRTAAAENRRTVLSHTSTSTSPSFEGKGFRFRSPSKTQDHPYLAPSGGGVPSSSLSDNNHQTQRRESSPSPSAGGGGDVLLQWGQRKRSRVSRVVVADESSSSVQARQAIKVQRRALAAEKLSVTAQSATMPPPPPPPPIPPPSKPNTCNNGRGGNIRPGMLTSASSAFLPKRNLEERSGARNNGAASGRVVSKSTAGKRSPPSPENFDRKIPCSGGDHMSQVDSAGNQSEQEAAAANNTTPTAVGEKENLQVFEWPRIYIALSRKEKEDDFLAMKGKKLPQRPKKRAKNIDKCLQYCFPGMWLSDLTRNRYEVREKRCVKKQKRRGLKGMESMDSDSC